MAPASSITKGRSTSRFVSILTVPEFFIRFLSFPAHTKDVRSMIDWQQNIIL